jgi:hypothetical protein
MGLYADRVQETTTTTGTGTVTLAGAVSGYRTFTSAIVTGDRVNYTIALGTEWETGDGVLETSSTLTRENVFASSNSNALVSFSAGSKLVWIDIPAQAVADIGLALSVAANLIPQ